jgi:hypothetical protein
VALWVRRRTQRSITVAARRRPQHLAANAARAPGGCGRSGAGAVLNVGVIVTKKILQLLSARLRLGNSTVLPLLGVAFLVWSLLEPAPMTRIATITVSQALGTAAFAIYVYLGVRELRREILRAQSRDPS